MLSSLFNTVSLWIMCYLCDIKHSIMLALAVPLTVMDIGTSKLDAALAQGAPSIEGLLLLLAL